MLAKLRAQLRAKGICKSQKKNLASLVSTLSITHSRVQMFVQAQAYAVVVMGLQW